MRSTAVDWLTMALVQYKESIHMSSQDHTHHKASVWSATYM